MSRVNVTTAVMCVPSRTHRRGVLAAALGSEPLWVEDTDETGDTWRQYQRCLEAGAKRGTHRLVLQDDALPVEGFAQLLHKLVAAHPLRVICLYVPALPAAFGRQMLQASNDGREVVELTKATMFVPVVATVWPIALADSCAHWPGHQRGPQGSRGRADDARVADWFKAQRPQRYPLGAVPCLVDHDEAEASSLANGGRYPRRAAILPSTPAGELTIA